MPYCSALRALAQTLLKIYGRSRITEYAELVQVLLGTRCTTTFFVELYFPEGCKMQISSKLDVSCSKQDQIGISDLDYLGIHYFQVEKRGGGL